jgi:hypothetical protein
MAAELRRFGAACAAAVEAGGDVHGMGRLEAEHRARVADILRAAWRQAGAMAVRDLADAAKAGFGIQRKDALGDIIGRIVDRIGLRHATEIARTSARKIRDVIKNAISQEEAPLGQAELGKLIRQRSDDMSVPRANMIARTESHAALQTAQVETVQAMDLPNQRKEWIAVHDARTRPDHADTDGKVLPMTGKFHVGMTTMDHPGDPNATGIDAASQVINCRCILVFSAGRHKPREMPEQDP